jgi:hypothetical protein
LSITHTTPDRKTREISISKALITNEKHSEIRRRCWRCTLAGLAPF